MTNKAFFNYQLPNVIAARSAQWHVRSSVVMNLALLQAHGDGLLFRFCLLVAN